MSKVIIILFLIFSSSIFSQKYSDVIFLKNDRTLSVNIVSVEFRSIKVESEETNFILISRIDSIKTNQKEIIDSLKYKYKNSICIAFNNSYVLDLSEAILEERTYEVSLFTGHSVSLFLSSAYFSRFGVQYNVAPTFISDIIICKIEYAVGFQDNEVEHFDNSNIVLGLGISQTPISSMEIGLYLNYGISNFSNPDNWINYAALSVFGKYFFTSNESMFFQFELNYLIGGENFDNRGISNDARAGFGVIF